jgi:probable HAF family extracellular repeat protein
VRLPGLTIDNHIGKAWAINAGGQIAGVSGGSEGVFYAVRWDTRTAPPLQIGPLPGAFNSEGRGINIHGDVVGRSSGDTVTEAFVHLDDGDTLVGLGFLPGGDGYSEAFGINAARHVVGVSRAGEAIVHATLWIDGVAHDLNDLVDSSEITTLTSAAAINDAGDIAAEADLPDGNHAIVLLRRQASPARILAWQRR